MIPLWIWTLFVALIFLYIGYGLGYERGRRAGSGDTPKEL